tara:strand:+ start:213 stop:440 length:228 start_codon:yes stop_codon:yes gene_type:complete
MRFPDDNLPKLLRRASLARLRLDEAAVALVFVFTTIGILFFFLDLIYDIHVAPPSSAGRRWSVINVFRVKFVLVA